MKTYKHLNQQDRDRLEALLDAGHKQKEIAKVLEKDPSTISREIKRNKRKRTKENKPIKKGPYESTKAQEKARTRRKLSKYQGLKIEKNNELKKYIIKKLTKHWSPDAISGRMRKDKESFYASKNLIYEWLYGIWGQRYCKYLFSERYYPKKRKKASKKTIIPNRKGIGLRPKLVNQRKTYGHFEGDTVVSPKRYHTKTALVVISERKAKYFDLKKINSLKPRLFAKSVSEMEEKLTKDTLKSLTLDNGIENRDHEKIGTKTYFCDPYSSYQKGGVENVIRLIRRFIPKGSDLNQYSGQYIEAVVNMINNQPRKSLNYKTPYEVMIENDLFTKKTIFNIKKSQAQKIALRG